MKLYEATTLQPYVIAEIGVNHEGSMRRAKALIEAAARSGAHAAKFQTYKADLLASPDLSPAYWDTSKEKVTSQHSLFSKYDSFTPSDYEELARHCASSGIAFMSTPFDLESVDMLRDLVPAFKIASADITNVPLIRKVARTGLPILMSVGAATHDEIEAALGVVEAAGAPEITLLHCVLNYPTPEEHANLLGISTLRERFGSRARIGYSDHVSPDPEGRMLSLEAAVWLGAEVIEKHFTDDREAPGNDHYHAADELALLKFSTWVQRAFAMGGSGQPNIAAQSRAVDNARRRVFASADISKGSVLTEEMLVALRANQGIPIAMWDSIMGRFVQKDVRKGDPLTEEHLR